MIYAKSVMPVKRGPACTFSGSHLGVPSFLRGLGDRLTDLCAPDRRAPNELSSPSRRPFYASCHLAGSSRRATRIETRVMTFLMLARQFFYFQNSNRTIDFSSIFVDRKFEKSCTYIYIAMVL